jgi:hypothetical protein
MPYTSPEVLQLEAIRDWMETLSVWSGWAGAGRVVWPIKAAPNLPVCVLALNAGRTVNLTGAAGGANFQPSGSITLWIYAADTNPEDPQLGYTVFADKFFGLISQMADSAHVAPVLFNEFATPDTPIVHSSWVNTEDDDEGLDAWWQGQITIRWGVEQ